MKIMKIFLFIFLITNSFIVYAQKSDSINVIYIAYLKPAINQTSFGKKVYLLSPLLDSDYINCVHPDKLTDGIWEDYFKEDSNKVSYRISYRDSLPNGLSEYYYLNGNVKGITNFKNGTFDGYQAKFYPDGILMSETKYVADKETGPRINYYENGQVESEDYYENGTIFLHKEWDLKGSLIKIIKPEDGTHFSFYANGKKAIENKIKNGHLYLHKEWDENGELIKSVKYK